MSINFEAKIKDPEGNIIAKLDLGWDISHINKEIIRFLWGTDGLKVRDFKCLDKVIDQYPEVKVEYDVDLTSINEILEISQDDDFYSEINLIESFSNDRIKTYIESKGITKALKEILLRKIEEEEFELSIINKAYLGLTPIQDILDFLLDAYENAKKGDLDELSNDIISLVASKPETFFKKAYGVIGDIYTEELLTRTLKSPNVSKEYKNHIYEEYFSQIRGALVSNIVNLSYTREMVNTLVNSVSPQEILYMVKNNNFLDEIPGDSIKDIVAVIIDLEDIYSEIEDKINYLKIEQIQKIISRTKSADISEILSNISISNNTMISLISSGVQIDSDFFKLPISKKDRYIFNLAIANYQPGWAGVDLEILNHPFLDSNIIEKYYDKFSSIKTLASIYRHRNELITDGILKKFKEQALEKMDFKCLSLIKEWSPEEQEMILKGANKNTKTSFAFFESTQRGDAIRSKLITKMVTSPDILKFLENENKNYFTSEELERIYKRIAKAGWVENNLPKVLRSYPKEKYPLLLEKYSRQMSGIKSVYDVLNDNNIIKMLKNVAKNSYFGYQLKDALPENKIIMCFQTLPANDSLLKKLYEEFLKSEKLFENPNFRSSEFYKEMAKDFVVQGFSKKEIQSINSLWRIKDAVANLNDKEREVFVKCYLEGGKKLLNNEVLVQYLSKECASSIIREELKENIDADLLDSDFVEKIDDDLFKDALKTADYYDLKNKEIIKRINSLDLNMFKIIQDSSKIDSLDYNSLYSLSQNGAKFSKEEVLEFVKNTKIESIKEVCPSHIGFLKEFYNGNLEAFSYLIDAIEPENIKKYFSDEELIQVTLQEDNFYIYNYINADLIPEDKIKISKRTTKELLSVARSNKYSEKVKEHLIQNLVKIDEHHLDEFTQIYGKDFLNEYVEIKLNEHCYTVSEDNIHIDPFVVLAELESEKLVFKKGLNKNNKTLISQLFNSLRDNVYHGKLDTRNQSIDFEGNIILLERITREGVSNFIDSSLEYILNSEHIELGVIPVKIRIKNGKISISGTGDFLGGLFSKKIEKIKKKIIEKSEEFSVELNNITSSIDRKFTLSIDPKEYYSSDIIKKALVDTESKNTVNVGTRAHKHTKNEWRITERRKNSSDRGGRIMSPIFSDASGLNEIKGVCERLADENISGRIVVAISISDFSRKISSYYNIVKEVNSVSSLLNPFVSEDIDINSSPLCGVNYNPDSRMVKFWFDTKITYDNIVHFIELACSLVKASIYKLIGKHKESKEYITSLSEEAFIRRFHNDLESEEMTNMIMLYELVGRE